MQPENTDIIPNPPVEGHVPSVNEYREHQQNIPNPPPNPPAFGCPLDKNLPNPPVEARAIPPVEGLMAQKVIDPNIQSGLNPPSLIKIGYERAGIDQFNDLQLLTENKHVGPYKICQVKVQWNKHHILGIKMAYDGVDDHCMEGHDITRFRPFNELFGQINKETFNVDKDDVILEVFGRVDDHINKLGFRTYKGHFCEFGQDVGQFFSYRFPGFTFGPISGGYGDYLDFLVLLTQPLQERHRVLMNLVPPM